MIKKILTSLLVALVIIAGQATYVLAISDPDAIAWGTGTVNRYKAFTNVLSTGDILFTAEVRVDYTVEPTDYTASEAFVFELLNTAGNVTYASTPLVEYGVRPIGIYLTPSQVTSLGLSSGTAYGLRLTGNPTVFPTQNSSNTITLYLSGDDWVDQATSGNTTLSNHLRNFMLLVAEDIEDNDSPSPSYLAVVRGITYLSTAGADIFLAGIPSLDSMVEVLFLYSIETLTDSQPSSTGGYAALITPTSQWGSSVATGLTNLGVYLGINQALAGATVAFIFGALLAILVYKRLQSGVATLMLMATYPFVIAWLGLMPMALAFVFTMLVVILGGTYFWRQGAL